jgi:hypothetical protein
MGEKKGTLFYYPPFETNETRGVHHTVALLAICTKKVLS